MRRSDIVLILLVPALPLGVYLAMSARQTTATVAEVERQIDQTLPVGSSREQVESWLAERGIPFSFAANPAGYSSELEALPDIGRYTGAVVGYVHYADRGFLSVGEIWVYFLLGADGRFEKRLAHRRVIEL